MVDMLQSFPSEIFDFADKYMNFDFSSSKLFLDHSYDYDLRFDLPSQSVCTSPDDQFPSPTTLESSMESVEYNSLFLDSPLASTCYDDFFSFAEPQYLTTASVLVSDVAEDKTLCIQPSLLLAEPSEFEESDIEIDVVTIDPVSPLTSITPQFIPLASPSHNSRNNKQLSKRHSVKGLGNAAHPVKKRRGDALDIETRRHVHNVLERRRRNDLKTSFDNLRCTIPELEKDDKSPKVQILRRAAELVLQLKQTQQDLCFTKNSLLADNLKLQERLRKMQLCASSSL